MDRDDGSTSRRRHARLPAWRWRHARIPPWRMLLRYSVGVRIRVVLGGALTFLGTLIALSQPLLSQQILMALTTRRPVLPILAELMAAVLVGAVISALGYYLLEYAGETVVLNMRTRLVQKILRLRIAVTDQIPPGDLMSRLIADTTVLRQITTQGLVMATTGVISLIGALILMGWLDMVLLLVTLASVTVMTVTIRWSTRKIGKASGEVQAAIAVMATLLDRSLGAFRTVKAAGAEPDEIERLTESARGSWRRGLHLARWQATSGTTAILTMQVAFLAVLGVGGARVAAGAISVATLIAFMLFMLYLGQPINSLVTAYGQYQSGIAAVARVEQVLALAAEPAEPAGDARKVSAARDARKASDAGAARDARKARDANLGSGQMPVVVLRGRTPLARRSGVVPAPRTISPYGWPVAGRRPARAVTSPRPNGSAGPAGAAGATWGCAAVDFENVVFGYSRTTQPVHHGVTFAVPPGGMTAIVGPSGAGKSTLFALIERFYDVTSGRVLVDGRDVRYWPLGQLRASIGYVEQDTPALAGTLRENLTLGLGKVPDEQLRQVIATARLEQFVAALPNGLDGEIGYRGGTLSGGERQRLAIARALLRAPRLLLLDEATSHLDAANEQALRDAITAAASTTTVMVVAHRLSTVVGARQIVVMEAGRVRSCGTHDELLQLDPLYRDLAATQLLASPAS